jgi:hypothetical protein
MLSAAKYRAPSPQTSSMSKIGLGGSMKESNLKNNNLKTSKWK